MNHDTNASQTSFSEIVRDLIRDCLLTHRQAPNLANLARSMGISGRTFRRRLNKDGKNLSQVLTDVRVEIANSEKGKTREEMAEILGFSEAKSVSRIISKLL